MARFLVLFLLILGGVFSAGATDKPNIILVLVDDMGWGDLSLNQQEQDIPKIETPHLAKLAQSGMRLRRHYTCAPVCAPARASLFSGVHQGHAEVVRNNSFDAALENSHTLASILKTAGYTTALIGKWGIGGGQESGGTPTTAAAWPTRRGFDYFFGYHNHIAGHVHYPKEEPNRDPETHCNAIWDGSQIITDQLDGCYSTDLFTARAKKWIIDHQHTDKDKPFFLALTFIAPHARLAVPAEPYPAGGGLQGGVQWLGKAGHMINTANTQTWDTFIYPQYRKAWESYATHTYGDKAQQKLEAARRHATMITRIDDAMGDLSKLCQDLGIERNTVIIFTSDNGPHNEAGAVYGRPNHPALAQDPSFFRSFGSLDGIKRDAWEGGLRVPCIVSMPGTIATGVNDTPSQFQDWMATFAELAGIPQPMRCDGVSLVPTLKGIPQEQKTGTVYAEYAYSGSMVPYPSFADNKKGRSRGEQQILYFRSKDNQWLKAIRTGIHSGMEDFEIYDTLEDSHESHNLADQLPGIQEHLKREVLYNRRAYSYQRAHNLPTRRNPCGGRRPYDNLHVPATPDAPNTQPGLRMRRLLTTCPWVPEFDTLPQVNSAENSIISTPNEIELPAGSITEFKGYINIPQRGDHWHFYLTLDPVPGSKAYLRMHHFQLIDADASYTPGKTADETSAANAEEKEGGIGSRRGIPLEAGLHEISLVVVQGSAASGRLRLEWNQGAKDKQTPRELIPSSAFACPVKNHISGQPQYLQK